MIFPQILFIVYRVPKTLGTYVFHAVMFYEGTVSYGSNLGSGYVRS